MRGLAGARGLSGTGGDTAGRAVCLPYGNDIIIQSTLFRHRLFLISTDPLVFHVTAPRRPGALWKCVRFLS